MPEQIPWELVRNNMRSFAHDSLAILQPVLNRLEVSYDECREPALWALCKECHAIGQALGGIHSQFWDFRQKETAPKNWDLTLAQYKRVVRRVDQKLDKLVGKLKAFHRKNRGALNSKAVLKLNEAVELLQQQRKMFPANQLGAIKVNTKTANIYRFLKSFSSRSFVDREGRPVKVVFRGRNLGDVSFDPELMYRSVYNLVTDALNHTPGRPIFVTLNAKDGQAVINVTNEGPKLKPEEIAKIGRVRFTRAWHDPKRGYGKISTRLLTEAQGGAFRAGNSRIGPMLSISMPRLKKMRRI